MRFELVVTNGRYTETRTGSMDEARSRAEQMAWEFSSPVKVFLLNPELVYTAARNLGPGPRES